MSLVRLRYPAVMHPAGEEVEGRVSEGGWPCGASAGALTVTAGLGPDVSHAAVEQVDQHQPVAVQQNLPAAFVAGAGLETR